MLLLINTAKLRREGLEEAQSKAGLRMNIIAAIAIEIAAISQPQSETVRCCLALRTDLLLRNSLGIGINFDPLNPFNFQISNLLVFFDLIVLHSQQEELGKIAKLIQP